MSHRSIGRSTRGLAGYLWLAATMPSVAADDALGAHLAAACAACHRLDGGGTGVPVVGREPEKFVALLQGFKADARTNHIMHAVSLSLSNEEVAAVAAHLARLGKDAKSP